MCQNQECFCQNIFRNLSFKTAPSKNTFSVLHPQKANFKKKVQKIASSKNKFSKLLSQKN